MILHQQARSVDWDGALEPCPLFRGTVSSILIDWVCKILSLLGLQAVQLLHQASCQGDSSLQCQSFLQARSYRAISSTFTKSLRSYYSTGRRTSKILFTAFRAPTVSLY